MIPLPAAASQAVFAAALLAGCTAADKPRAAACMPTVGMHTGDLAACGCRRYDGGSMRTLPTSRAAGGTAAEAVIIVNYLCSLGDAGVAWATVINGTVDRVEY
ncbi:MAG: hypothetical protein LJE69_05090 [Thiohalocapsa sp.]|jgi:hypothetical protein|uniref:hypothetical protein n=1 Tax=Thiohalocapsa sp. TaxID=2497641 RepID=UPI0025FCB5E8|nr:hypothetical protein [Thiohalocapsa sp.]MCG6940607.1 hypothetical protein [Thiohalocapsa sp.]